MTRRRLRPGRIVEKNNATDEEMIVGRCAGCGEPEAVLREVAPDRWRCRGCRLHTVAWVTYRTHADRDTP